MFVQQIIKDLHMKKISTLFIKLGVFSFFNLLLLKKVEAKR
jgi:hypothetical protein